MQLSGASPHQFAMRACSPVVASACCLRFARITVRRGRIQLPCYAAAEVATHNGVSDEHVVVRSVVPPAPATPAQAPALLGPAALYTAAAKAGSLKAALPLPKAFALAVLAGVYISFAALLSFSLLNAMPGLLASNPGLAKLLSCSVFPMGLALIVICGAELFTGNTALTTVAVLEGQATWSDVLARWAVVYAGNLAGSLFMVAAVAATGLMAGNTVVPAVAVAKTSQPLLQVLMRAVLCNWLVCLAVWTALAASTLPGKLLGLWLPVVAFVSLGLEHAVANMFIIPMGMALGAPVTVAAFLTANLLPVTLGNIFAGTVCTAGMYSLCYGRLGAGL